MIRMCRIPSEFEVLEFYGTKESALEISKHCDGVAHLTAQGEWQVMIGGDNLAEKGDFVVNDKAGGWQVFDEEEFNQHFEMVSDQVTYDDQTMIKVSEALQENGVDVNHVPRFISSLQNRGILFRERV